MTSVVEDVNGPVEELLDGLITEINQLQEDWRRKCDALSQQ